MAIRDILFHLDTSEVAQSVSDFAVSLADVTRAHLTAAGVVIEYPPPAADLGGFTTGWDFSSAQVFAEISDRNRKAAEGAYERLVTAVPSSVQTELVIIQALQEIARDEFGRLARHFDLSVVSQGTPETGLDEQLMISSALFASGRPVFIVPSTHKGPAKLEKAMVCWDGGVQAARALAESLPLLSRARSVEVVCVRCKGQTVEQLPGFNITRHLSRHGITATLRELPPADDVGSAILSHAADSAADYIVIGAYGHWRLRELIFGGTTRTILTSTMVPAFMAH